MAKASDKQKAARRRWMNGFFICPAATDIDRVEFERRERQRRSVETTEALKRRRR